MSTFSSAPRLFLTVGETAATLRVDPATIYRAIRSGHFPAVRVRGRYVVPSRAVDELVTRALETGGCVDVSDVELVPRTVSQSRPTAEPQSPQPWSHRPFHRPGEP